MKRMMAWLLAALLIPACAGAGILPKTAEMFEAEMP